MGKLFILLVEEDDFETVEKIMAFIESTKLVICFLPVRTFEKIERFISSGQKETGRKRTGPGKLFGYAGGQPSTVFR